MTYTTLGKKELKIQHIIETHLGRGRTRRRRIRAPVPASDCEARDGLVQRRQLLPRISHRAARAVLRVGAA